MILFHIIEQSIKHSHNRLSITLAVDRRSCC